MRRATWVKVLANFDLEPLIGSVFLGGVVVSVGLLLGGVVWQWAAPGYRWPKNIPQGANVFHFMMLEFQRASSGLWQPQRLRNLGLAVLLWTPYVRVLASTFYFACIERTVTSAVLRGCTLVLLTYIMFFG